jgi:hypothetical protein
MSKTNIHIFFNKAISKMRRLCSVLLVAFILGVSNVIMEEDRMINDTRAKIEQRQDQSEEE